MAKTLQKIGGAPNQGKMEVVDTAGVCSIKLDGVQILGSQGAAVADAVVAHDINATFSDTEVEATLDALGVQINLIIARLEAAGIIAS